MSVAPMMGYATESWERVYMLCLTRSLLESDDEVIKRIDGILRSMERTPDVARALHVVLSVARGATSIDDAFAFLRDLSERHALA